MSRAFEDSACTWSRRLEPFARVGLLGLGLVYLAMGGLACSAAIGGGRAAGPEGAAAGLAGIAGGRALLVASSLGLAMATLSAALQALRRRPGGRWACALARGRWLGCALFYASVAWLLVDVLRHAGNDPSGDRAARGLTAALLARPLGRWAAMAAAVAMIAYGAWRILIAARATFLGGIPTERMRRGSALALRWLGRVGIIAVGAVAIGVGAWLLVAAARANPALALGMGGAISEFRRIPAGNVAVLAVAVGLALYGIHQWLLAVVCPADSVAAEGT
jgi:hypothetical protein